MLRGKQYAALVSAQFSHAQRMLAPRLMPKPLGQQHRLAAQPLVAQVYGVEFLLRPACACRLSVRQPVFIRA